jgi:hypothetical protein
MATATFGEAAAYLGHKSRSTLYRLRNDGLIDAYLRPGGRGGAPLLELEPEGRPTLRRYLKTILVARSDSPLWREPEPDAEPWPPEPLELSPLADAGPDSFWAQFGDWRPDEELDDDAEDEHVARIAWHMMNGAEETPPPSFRNWLRDLEHFIIEARDDVAKGVRWSTEKWARGSIESLLPDVPDCPAAAAEMRVWLQRDDMPADLIEPVNQALAAFERNQALAAL